MRSQLAKLGAFLVAVLLIILGFTVKLETIKGWVQGIKIVVNSKSRGDVGEYLAGEVLKFSLGAIKSPRVFWVFEEDHPLVGGVEAEFAFPFDPSVPSGQARDRRVDVFFKSGDGYRTASTIVRTRNVNYTAAVGIQQSRIVFTAPESLGSEWRLTGASLDRFSDGLFTTGHALTAVGSGDNTQYFSNTAATLAFLGYPAGTDIASVLASDDRAWASYQFVNTRDRSVLRIAKQLATKP